MRVFVDFVRRDWVQEYQDILDGYETAVDYVQLTYYENLWNQMMENEYFRRWLYNNGARNS